MREAEEILKNKQRYRLKNMRKITIAFFISLFLCIVFLAAMVGWFYFENAKLQREALDYEKKLNATSAKLAKANDELIMLNRSLNELSAELDSTKQQLNMSFEMLAEREVELNKTKEELYKTIEELNTTKNILNLTKYELAELTEEVNDLEKSINDSVAWFKENSLFSHSLDPFVYRIERSCIKEKKLNLACVSFLTGKYLGINYISEYPDRLLSLKDFTSRKGGDCEDFALFFKAMINTLKKSHPEVVAEVWEKGSGRYVVYTEKNENGLVEWYIEGNGISIDRLDLLNPYVVCFAVDHNSGHCVVALSEKEIHSIEEIDQLNGAALFEPQLGEYNGVIGKQLILCEKGEPYCERKPNHISFIITDDDLFQFTNGSWKSFAYYRQKTLDAKEKLLFYQNTTE